MRENRNNSSTFAFVLVIAVIGLITIFRFNKIEVLGKKFGGDYIARVHISGEIEKSNYSYNQDWLMDTIDTLQNDSKNVGMILDIDSPGGTIFETDEVYFKLLEYKEDKPIYTYVESMAASGAYYMACATDYIVANRNSLTGCVGVIYGEAIDVTGLLDRYGVKVKTFHSGRNKIMGSLFEPLTKEQEEIFQSISDDAYDQFVSIVAKGRNLPMDKTLELSDGRVYTAKQALENKIIDRIGTFEDTKKLMEEKCFDEKEMDIEEFSYIPKQTLMDSIIYRMGFTGKASSNPEIPDAVQKILSIAEKGPSYLYLGL